MIIKEEGSVMEYKKHSEKIAAGVPNVESEKLKGVDEAKNEEISYFTKDKIDILVLNQQNLPGEQINCKIEELVVMCIYHGRKN
uniref:Bm1410, isoform a n=1 Tax=Brugia malayi TaxID=6279 RepID=A0A0J9XYL3_BRUMA|nr:Bm1410, isoform a [Brugia malayi]